MWEGCLADTCTVLVATRVLPGAGCGSPVLALGSKRGALDEETATRMRWPLLKISDVLHRSTSISYTLPDSSGSPLPAACRGGGGPAPSGARLRVAFGGPL